MILKHLRPLAAAALLSLPLVSMAEDAGSAQNMTTIENFGWFVAESTQKLEFNDAEKEAFMKGVKQALDGQDGPEDKQTAAMQVQQYLQQRFNTIQEGETKKFFEELAANPNVKQSPTGLYYEIIEEGDAERAGADDSVKVNYKGSLIDGTEFDSSYKRGEPATFPVGGVVKGFGEGVQLVGPGGKVKLYIPGNLGYGPNPPRGSQIPPNGTLIFEVEMIDINPES
ncbi:FKBP-type peptidyl-prolyl cis-trans isomerase [Cerasicoccus fimbriatus]|uniref:FKBP-type peptidyl-prolyl cis-trans isomerase n=1 Tax=Cerasicoccus fimbriatus TaxID=3014554 RepID=UPI0022B2B943|nr:FKBP-type peptidyl-prolyl cis-trans isomerase [Cerasicoccus sp. TK19100]